MRRRGDDRSARFVCNIAAVLPDGRVLHTEETMEESSQRRRQETGGFGYDPILFLPEFGVTSADYRGTEKQDQPSRKSA